MTVRIILAIVGACTVALAMLATTGAQSGDAIPRGYYRGAVTDTSGLCDEGDLRIGNEFSLRINAAGTAITGVTVSDPFLATLNVQLNEYTVPVTIPIGNDGTFSQDFDVIGSVDAHIDGAFAGDSVSGNLAVRLDGEIECEGTFTAQGEQLPEPEPALYLHAVEESGNCGGGTVLITVSRNERSILAIEVRDVQAEGESLSASAAFDEGTVPLSDASSYDWIYFAGPELGQEIALIGTVGVGGGLTIEPSSCGVLELTPIGLPSVGAGDSSQNSMHRWLVGLAAVGVMLVVGGVAARDVAGRWRRGAG